MAKSNATCFNYSVDKDLIDDFKRVAKQRNDNMMLLLEAFLRTFIDNEYPLNLKKRESKVKKECNIKVDKNLRDSFNTVVKQRGLNREDVISNFLSDYIAEKVELKFFKVGTKNIIKAVVEDTSLDTADNTSQHTHIERLIDCLESRGQYQITDTTRQTSSTVIFACQTNGNTNRKDKCQIVKNRTASLGDKRNIEYIRRTET